jgi:hypothetical protein
MGDLPRLRTNALSLLSANWLFVAACVLPIMEILWPIPKEEQMMIEASGSEYQAYLQGTGKFPRNFRRSKPMSEKVAQSLEGVSETLLMTLYVRARESHRPNAVIKDNLAVAMVNQIDCDFSRLRLQRHDEDAILMRMNKFDSHVRDFL